MFNVAPMLEATSVGAGYALCAMVKVFVYLTALVDMAYRSVLAHKVAVALEASHAKEVIEQALARYGAPENINSDQYTDDDHNLAVQCGCCVVESPLVPTLITERDKRIVCRVAMTAIVDKPAIKAVIWVMSVTCRAVNIHRRRNALSSMAFILVLSRREIKYFDWAYG